MKGKILSAETILSANTHTHTGARARAAQTSIMTVYTKLNFDASNTPYDSVTQVGWKPSGYSHRYPVYT